MWSSVWSGRWPVVLAGAGVVVLLAAVGWLAAPGDLFGLDKGDLSSVIAALLAAAGAVCSVVGWAWQRRRVAGLPASAEQLDQAAATLAGLVREQWMFEAQAQALDDPEPMPVRWRLTPHLADHPQVINPGGPVEFNTGAQQAGELAAAFRALPRRRLVITGGPGTGKTTLAVQLVLALLPAPGQPPAEPVPVLVSLADWDPQVQPRVADWLAARIDDAYPALRATGPDVPAALVVQGRVLPVLDGLDEVPPDRAAAIVTALNASLPGGVILTSRRPEYRAAITTAGDRVTGAAALGPHPLTRGQAATYLRHLLPPDPGPAWTRVLDTLDPTAPGDGVPGAALARLVATPLGLWLVRAVYVDPQPRDRPDPARLVAPSATVDSLRAELLDQLVPALLAARPPVARRRRHAPEAPGRPRRRYRPEQLRRTLAAVAAHLHRSGTRDWQWWNPVRLPGRRSRIERWRSRLRDGTALRTGLPIALLSGTGLGMSGGWVAGLAGGVFWGCVFGLGSVLVSAKANRDRPPGVLDLRMRGRGRELAIALRNGLAIGVAISLVISLPIVISDVLILPLLVLILVLGLTVGVGVPVGLVISLILLTRNMAAAARAPSPSASFRGARRAAAVPALFFGLVIGWIGFSDAVTSSGLPVIGLVAVTVLSVAAGIATGLTLTAWVYRIVLTRGFAGRPWRVMRRLEDCHRLGLLRAVGPVYQFRHAELQHHLAAPHRRHRPSSDRPSPPGTDEPDGAPEDETTSSPSPQR